VEVPRQSTRFRSKREDQAPIATAEGGIGPLGVQPLGKRPTALARQECTLVECKRRVIKLGVFVEDD
jgi:hypothetical protein